MQIVNLDQYYSAILQHLMQWFLIVTYTLIIRCEAHTGALSVSSVGGWWARYWSGLSQARSRLQHKTQAAQLRSLEEFCAAGVTQVLRPAISFPARKCDNQSIKRQSRLWRKGATMERTHIVIWWRSVRLCIYSKTWKCSLLSSNPWWQTLWESRMHMYSHRYTHTDRCCIVMACPTLAACFFQTSHPVWWLTDDGGRGSGGGAGGGVGLWQEGIEGRR